MRDNRSDPPPSLDFPGYVFGPTAHGIMMAAEPDEVTSAVITYPGGTESAALHRGALEACVGQGHHVLEQTTVRGVHLKPIDWRLLTETAAAGSVDGSSVLPRVDACSV